MVGGWDFDGGEQYLAAPTAFDELQLGCCLVMRSVEEYHLRLGSCCTAACVNLELAKQVLAFGGWCVKCLAAQVCCCLRNSLFTD